jgi:hypothetical protein
MEIPVYCYPASMELDQEFGVLKVCPFSIMAAGGIFFLCMDVKFNEMGDRMLHVRGGRQSMLRTTLRLNLPFPIIKGCLPNLMDLTPILYRKTACFSFLQETGPFGNMLFM